MRCEWKALGANFLNYFRPFKGGEEPSPDELVHRLRTHNEEIIKVLFELVQDKQKEEEGRKQASEQKAFSVFQSSTVLIGLFFTALTFAFKELRIYAPYLPRVWIETLMALIILFYIGAIVFSWLGFKVRKNWKTSDYGDLFEIESNDENGNAHKYRRYIIAHRWLVYSVNTRLNDTRHQCVGAAQVCLLSLSILMCILASVVGCAVVGHIGIEGVKMEEGTKTQTNVGTQAPVSPPEPTKVPSAGSDVRKGDDRPAPTLIPTRGRATIDTGENIRR